MAAIAPATEKSGIRLDGYDWSNALSVTVDLDRSGSEDRVQLAADAGGVALRVRMDASLLPVIHIPIDGSKQFGICPGSPPRLTLQPQSEAPLNALGETPPGYDICPACMELMVSGGDCDPLHFYWDSSAGKLAWWRE